MEGELGREGHTDEEERDGGVHFGDVPKRDGDPLGTGATGMRAGTGDHSADDREKRKRAHLQPGQEDEIPSRRPAEHGSERLPDRW